MSRYPIAGVVLAAGASRRLGTPKQLLIDEAGRALVLRAATQLLDAGCAPVLVVTGASRDAVAQAIAALDVQVVPNDAWEEGLASSIRAAIESLERRVGDDSPSAALIVACDMPSVSTEHLTALATASAGGRYRVASEYLASDGRRVQGIPAILPQADWTALKRLSGDRGARDLLNSPRTLSVFLRDGNFDLDTPADLARWRGSRRSSTTHQPLPAMPSMIAQTALADLAHEVAQTRRMLALVPADKLDFSPHVKSWPLGKLAKHLTDFGMWGAVTLTTSELNFADPMPPAPPTPTDAAGFVKLLDDRMADFNAALAEATDEQLMGTWTMKNGDAVLMSMPRVAVLRGMVISHMIHHRAQLTIYYRLLDIPVPGLYGPSADETQ